jgi:hypothetical protein
MHHLIAAATAMLSGSLQLAQVALLDLDMAFDAEGFVHGFPPERASGKVGGGGRGYVAVCVE